MAGLNASMNIGLTGLQASQTALDVIGHNIANVNTPGYSRQAVTLSSAPAELVGSLQYGMGVAVTNITSVRNKFLDMQITQSLSNQFGAQARYQGVQAVSSAFQDDGISGLNTQIQNFFAGVQQVAARPEDGAMRTNLVGTAQSLVTAFKSRYQMVEDQRSNANQQVSGIVEEVNSLTKQIAALNDRIATEPTPGADNDGRDQRKVLADTLAGLVGVQVFEDNKSRLQITLDSGAAVLVSGNTAFTVHADMDANKNYQITVSQGGGISGPVVTGQIKGGTLGGEIDLRDKILPGFQDKLDALAAGIAGKVNLVNRAGYGLPGGNPATGVDLFQSGVANGANGLPPGIPGAAGAGAYRGMVGFLSVNAAVVADPRLIAAATSDTSTGTVGDNSNAQKMAKLLTDINTVDADGDGTGDSGPYTTMVAGLSNAVGTASQGYNSTATNLENLNSALQQQRNSASAVDMDEEASKMLAYQRGYQAAARFINVISQLTDQLVNGLGK